MFIHNYWQLNILRNYNCKNQHPNNTTLTSMSSNWPIKNRHCKLMSSSPSKEQSGKNNAREHPNFGCVSDERRMGRSPPGIRTSSELYYCADENRTAGGIRISDAFRMKGGWVALHPASERHPNFIIVRTKIGRQEASEFWMRFGRFSDGGSHPKLIRILLVCGWKSDASKFWLSPPSEIHPILFIARMKVGLFSDGCCKYDHWGPWNYVRLETNPFILTVTSLCLCKYVQFETFERV